MNTRTLILSMVTILVLLGFRMATPSLSDDDRKFGVNYLKETRAEVLSLVKGLTDEQLSFRASEDSWSIAQCLEHIAASEDFIFNLSQMALDNSAEKSELAFTDSELIRIMTDRSNKAKALDVLQPGEKAVTTTLKAFKIARDQHIAYLKKTDDALRSSYFDFPFGKGDAYQVLLFMGAHSSRHAAQIREILASPEFPK
ncbi:MAG: DinB family protein [Marinoscillum sp.]